MDWLTEDSKKNLKVCVCPAPPPPRYPKEHCFVLKFSGSGWCLSNNSNTKMKITEENWWKNTGWEGLAGKCPNVTLSTHISYTDWSGNKPGPPQGKLTNYLHHGRSTTLKLPTCTQKFSLYITENTEHFH